MKLATTTGDFDRWAYTYEEAVEMVGEAGFRYVDLCMGKVLCEREDGLTYAAKLREHTERLGMRFVQAHSPTGNPLYPPDREKLLRRTKRSIELCKVLGIPQTVIHVGWKKDIGEEEFFESNLAFIKELFSVMEETGVNVLVENSTRKNLGDYYYFFTGRQMADFLHYANHPLLHAVWDTGHGNTEGGQYEQLTALGKELYGLHIHDNSERGDEHTLPYFGSLNLDDVMNGIIDAGYNGYFTFEVLNGLLGSENRHCPRHAFERDKRLLEPTLAMRKDVERLLYTIGKHCLSSYGVFEE